MYCLAITTDERAVCPPRSESVLHERRPVTLQRRVCRISSSSDARCRWCMTLLPRIDTTTLTRGSIAEVEYLS
jgi:hypothetical protein